MSRLNVMSGGNYKAPVCDMFHAACVKNRKPLCNICDQDGFIERSQPLYRLNDPLPAR